VAGPGWASESDDGRGLLYGFGYMVSGLAASQHSLWGIYFGYGLLAGIGMGMGYICPVATLVKWFPDMMQPCSAWPSR